LLFAISLLGGVVLHLDLRVARRFAVVELNGILGRQFKGRVTIDRLAHLSLFGVSGVDATVTAADGTRVAAGKNIAGRVSPVKIIKSALFGRGDVVIGFNRVSIDAVDIDVDAGVDGSLKLVKAFDPATPATPSPPGSRGVAVDLERVTVKHAWAHGTMGGAPPIDADVDALECSFLLTSAAMTLDVRRLTLSARGLPNVGSASVAVEGHLAMPSPSGAPMAVRAKLAGDVGAIPLTARVSMDGNVLDAVLDLPEVSAAKVRASVAQAPVYESVSAHAEAHGDLANLGVAVGARLGQGTVTLDGFLHAKGPLGGSAVVVASHIDARTFHEGGPASDVSVRVEARAETRADGLVVADASVDMPEGTAAGQLVPHAGLRLSLTERPATGAAPRAIGAHLEGVISEPGAPVAVTVDSTTRDGASRVTFGAKATIQRMSEVKRLGEVGSGSAGLTVTGHAELGERNSFDAELVASAHGVDRPGTRIENVHVSARAHGTTASPEIAALIVATGLTVPGYRFSRAELKLAGTLQKGRVAVSAAGDGSPDVAISGIVSLTPPLTVSALAVGLKRQTEAVTIGVNSLRLSGPVIEASGIVVKGAGEPLVASFRAAPGAIWLNASSHGLDLGKLAYVAGQERKVGGTVALDVDVDARHSHGRGKVRLDLSNGEWSSLHGADAHVALTIDGRHLTGQLRAGVGGAGSLNLSDIDVHVGSLRPLEATSWRDVWGKLTVAANVDMARAAALTPAGSLHVADVAGRITVAGSIERDSPSSATPEVHLSLVTVGLAATGESTPPTRAPGGPLMVGPATWALHGIDARAGLIVQGVDGVGELDLRLVDEQGALIGVDLKTDPLPIEELLDGHADIVALMEGLRVSVLVDVPERELGSLPLWIRPDGVRGRVAATLTMKGTALNPVVDLALTTRQLVVAAASSAPPMDSALKGHYDGTNARVNVSVKTAESALLSAEVSVHARAKDILLARGVPQDWAGGATTRLARFPLGAGGALSDNQVKGLVSGDFEVTGLHQDAKAAARLTLDDLQIGKAKFTHATASATLDDKGLDAKLRVENPSGFLEAGAAMGTKWGSRLVPVSDGTGLEVKLLAKHFSAAAAAPFVSNALSELSGWVDADATVVLAPKQKPKMTGWVSLTDGVIEAPAIGEEFRAVKAKLTLDGDGLVKLEGVEARALSGRLTASGSAHLDGTALVGADVALDIRKTEAIPLEVQGTNLGTVYGDVTVRATGAADGKILNVAIIVPHFHVDLPSGSLPRAPQALADAPGVHMGTYAAPDRFHVLAVDGAPVKLVAERNAALASLLPAGGVGAPVLIEALSGAAPAAVEHASPLEIDATVHLGDVQVVRGQQVAINLDGDLTARVAAATTVRGDVHIKSGKLNVQSKEFEIEKGTISFVGDDPANPEVTVTAGWSAPDGTKVFADYVGPAKTGRVSLRTEPPRPKNEIVQLILFGTADGSEATPYASKSPSTGTQAGTAVGGLATDGLSKGLDQLTGMNVTTKVDTSNSSSPRADIELQIARDISLQLAYVIVQPPPGDNPDLVYATFDWRFLRNWSLETTFGDAGSTFVDMVWQYRY
jgi:translocation and assembly module TamB